MPDRLALSQIFLKRAGWGDALRAKLAGDASFRKYERLQHNAKRAVLMDAPPPHEDVRPFLHIARQLQRYGYSAPRILAEDIEHGFLLLEDLGDDLYARLIANKTDETPLYTAAIDFLLDLHRHRAPEGLASYSGTTLVTESELFIDWFLPAATGQAPDEGLRAEYRALWSRLTPQVEPKTPVLVLRDFHAENLIWLPERQGVAKVGLLDFQDAVAGHPAYDLVSLLEDARRDVSPALAEAMLERYIAGSSYDDADFRSAYSILGAQRNTRIIGVFTRLWKRDGKPQYLAFMPRMWGLLERDLNHPALAQLRNWFDHVAPVEMRRKPLPDAPLWGRTA